MYACVLACVRPRASRHSRSKIRVDRFGEVFGQFASLSVASGLRAQQLWSQYIVGLGLNAEDMVALAQKTLSSAAPPADGAADGSGGTSL